MNCPKCGSEMEKEADWPDEEIHWHCSTCGHEAKVEP